MLALGELPMVKYDLPQLVRQVRFEADQRAVRVLLWLRDDQPLALRIRQIVASEGSLLALARWRRSCGPQSCPCPASSRRTRTIRSTIPGGV